MNITVEKRDISANITIEIPGNQVLAERGKIVKAFSAQADIKGFRKGKVPTSVIEKRFSSDINAELEKSLLNKAINEAINKENLKVLNLKLPNAPRYGDDRSLNAEVIATLYPHFDLPVYKGLEIKVPSEEVTEEDLELSINNFLQRYAEYTDSEGDLEDGQIAVIDYTTNIAGKPIEEVVDTAGDFIATQNDLWLKINSESFLPGFTEQLKGLKSGDKKTVTITLADDFSLEALRGQKVNFEVEIKSTKHETIPELNEEFVSSNFQTLTVETLKNAFKDSIANEKQKKIINMKTSKVMELILADLSFELPQDLVEAETKENIRLIIREFFNRNNQEDIEKVQQMIEDTAKEKAIDTLRSQFVLQEIAEVEEIKVSDKELSTAIANLAVEAKKPVSKFTNELIKNDRIAYIKNKLLMAKTIAFLIASANVVTIETSVDDANV
jgi:trigger factor